MATKWIQVVGTFNRADHSGSFVAVQPAREENLPTERPESALTVVVEDAGGKRLTEVPVDPEFGSCDDIVDQGTFQSFLELPAEATTLRLLHEGRELSFFKSPDRAAMAAESFGLGPRHGHSVALAHRTPADPNATYTLQAREKGASIWQTLDIGLARPDVGVVDINQFPGAHAIEVRVLKSSGFTSEEIDKKEINFND
jgi:hypothetical protein